MRGGKPVGWGTIFVVFVVLWWLAKANMGNGAGGEQHNPNPQPTHSAVCNQYFKGGC